MTFIVDGTNGLTFPNSTTQASGGVVLQVVQGTLTSQVSTTSTSYVTTGLAASITPKFAISKILVFISARQYINLAGYSLSSGIDRSGTKVWGGYGIYNNGGASANNACIQYLDSPATTSSLTYTYFFAAESGATAYIFAGTGTGPANQPMATITLMEIAG